MSLLLQDRFILRDYVLFPGDSVMMAVDPRNWELVFGGPDAYWMDAQYAMKRGESSDTFYSRRLMEQDKESFLEQGNNREELERYRQEFGPELQVLELGRDGTDYSYRKLMEAKFELIPGWKELQFYKEGLAKDLYDLLEADLVGNYLSQEIRNFRQFQYGIPKMKGQQELLDRMDLMLPSLSEKIKEDIDLLEPSTFSARYNSLLTEWVKLERMIQGGSFEEIASANFEGEVLDRLLAGNLIARIQYSTEGWDYWENYAGLIQGQAWRALAETSLNAYQTGQVLAPVSWRDLDGKVWEPEDFAGKPTLFYFFFSTCSNSEKYFKNYLWPLYQETADQKGYRLVAVSVDGDRSLWKSELSTYSNPEILNLNMPLSEHESWLERYHIDAYPSTLLIDSAGRLLSFNLSGEDYSDYRDRFLKLLQDAEKNSTHLSK